MTQSRTFATLLNRPMWSTVEARSEPIHPHDLAPPPHSLRALMKSRRCFPQSPVLQPKIGGNTKGEVQPVRWVGERDWLKV
jgi:hypothetical protein